MVTLYQNIFLGTTRRFIGPRLVVTFIYWPQSQYHLVSISITEKIKIKKTEHQAPEGLQCWCFYHEEYEIGE